MGRDFQQCTMISVYQAFRLLYWYHGGFVYISPVIIQGYIRLFLQIIWNKSVSSITMTFLSLGWKVFIFELSCLLCGSYAVEYISFLHYFDTQIACIPVVNELITLADSNSADLPRLGPNTVKCFNMIECHSCNSRRFIMDLTIAVSINSSLYSDQQPYAYLPFTAKMSVWRHRSFTLSIVIERAIIMILTEPDERSS